MTCRPRTRLRTLAARLLVLAPMAACTQAADSPPGVRMVSGGVGEEERAALAATEWPWNLRLVFAERGTGAWLADVQVTLSDSAGRKLIETTSRGPLLLAALPEGSHHVVIATYDGRSETQRVSVRAGAPRTLYFYFPGQPVSEPAPSR